MKRKESGNPSSQNNKSNNSRDLSLRERKKLKQQVQVQETSSTNSNPRTIQVNEFVQARAFEIQSLEKALSNASQFTGSKRVFQTVPRFMRRRAASHNVKRLPKRLQQKAMEQMARDPEPPKKLSRRARRRSSRLFKDRLSSGMWLETHIWHAKRMKMVTKWGLKLAEHANMKNQRSLYRAAKHTVTAIDTSYLQVIELSGPVPIISEKLKHIVDPSYASIDSKKFIQGKKEGNGWFHDADSFPRAAICPFTFLWNSFKKGDQLIPSRAQLWIWVHVNSYKRVFELLTATFFDESKDVTITDLSKELNRFELRGPRSHAVLQHALSLADTSNPIVNPVAHELWSKLRELSNPGSIPQNTVFALTILDPRLANMPIIPPRKQITDDTVSTLQETLLMIPTQPISHSDIWSSEVRSRISQNQVGEGEINKRKSEHMIPGTPLVPLETDARIPILLIQKGSSMTKPASSKNVHHGSFMCGWDVVVPKGWALPLWRTLSKCGVLHGGMIPKIQSMELGCDFNMKPETFSPLNTINIGLRDRRQYHLENGMASFPQDYPETSTFCSDMTLDATEKLNHHNRIPPQKRFNYEALKTKSPFCTDFNGIDRRVHHEDVMADDTSMSENKEDKKSSNLRVPKMSPIPVLHSQNLIDELNHILQSINDDEHQILKEFPAFCRYVSEQMVSKKLIPTMTMAQNRTPCFENGEWLQICFVRIRITPIQEGDLHDFAMLYYPPQSVNVSAFPKWALTEKSKRSILKDAVADRQFACPEKDHDLIGYVTTGGYSLHLGTCSGIGVVPLSCVFRLYQEYPEK